LEGVTFREAHEIVGRVVRLAEEKGVAFTDLSPAALATVSPRLTEAIMAQLTVEGSLAHRGNVGGTSPQALADQLAAARQLLAP
jgi:argininosuccinate lyase